MPKEKVAFVHPGFLPDNSLLKPVDSQGFDFSSGKVTKRHMEREGNGIKIVEDGIVDRHAEIQSEKCNAGLENIIRLQEMRYGTIENAIARNVDKQQFANVANVPLSIAEQALYVKNVQDDVDALCAKLGISKEDLLKSNLDTLTNLLAAKQNASQVEPETGGNE